ncbi:MAG: cupredoxin domain-containing protein [Bradymonadaceae bacterium]
MSRSVLIRFAVVTLIAGFGLVSAACGGKQTAADAPPTQQAAPEAKARSIVLYQYGFHPNTLTIPVGTTITFKNRDPERHNINIAALNVDHNLEPSAEWTHTFGTTGEFAVTNRFSQAMKLTLVVE